MNQQSNHHTPPDELKLESPEATRQLAQSFAQKLKPGDIVYLEGNLGTGKTFFSQALIKATGYTGKVLSPTYSLVNSYDIHRDIETHDVKKSVKLRLHHFDLYRLAHPEELEFIGIRDYMNGQDICLIEWPSKGEGIIPPATIHILLEYFKGHAEGRIAKITYASI